MGLGSDPGCGPLGCGSVSSHMNRGNADLGKRDLVLSIGPVVALKFHQEAPCLGDQPEPKSLSPTAETF